MQNSPAQLEFVLSDKLNGVEIAPDTIGLATFNEFNNEVERFILGSQRQRLDELRVQIAEGSYKLVVTLTATIVASLMGDLKALQRQDSLGEIDPKRAAVLMNWQARTKSRPDLRFRILPKGIPAEPIELSSVTDFKHGDTVPWLKVEKYLFGTVVDMGGAQKANVHIRLQDTNEVVLINTEQSYLHDQQENRLYHKVLARVEAEQDYRTGKLRNLHLIAFEDYKSGYDEDALDRFADQGRRAWADVADAAEWVRKLRGGT